MVEALSCTGQVFTRCDVVVGGIGLVITCDRYINVDACFVSDSCSDFCGGYLTLS